MVVSSEDKAVLAVQIVLQIHIAKATIVVIQQHCDQSPMSVQYWSIGTLRPAAGVYQVLCLPCVLLFIFPQGACGRLLGASPWLKEPRLGFSPASGVDTTLQEIPGLCHASSSDERDTLSVTYGQNGAHNVCNRC